MPCKVKVYSLVLLDLAQKVLHLEKRYTHGPTSASWGKASMDDELYGRVDLTTDSTTWCLNSSCLLHYNRSLTVEDKFQSTPAPSSVEYQSLGSNRR